MPESFKMIFICNSKSSKVIVYFIVVIGTHQSSTNLINLSETRHKFLNFQDSSKLSIFGWAALDALNTMETILMVWYFCSMLNEMSWLK